MALDWTHCQETKRRLDQNSLDWSLQRAGMQREILRTAWRRTIEIGSGLTLSKMIDLAQKRGLWKRFAVGLRNKQNDGDGFILQRHEDFPNSQYIVKTVR